MGVGRDGCAGLPMGPGTARNTRSTPGVRPCSSVAHLRMAALIPVSAMPSVMSRTKKVTIGSGSVSKSTPSVVEEERDVAVRVQARRRDDVQLGLLGHPLHPREVAPEPDHRGVDDRLDPRPCSSFSFWTPSAMRSSTSQ